MVHALKLTAPILPGKRIEICAPELPESGEVELIIVLPETAAQPSPAPTPEAAHQTGGVLEFLASLPKERNPRLFDTWEEYERFLREERDSWDR